jgi:hypothetical protein
VSKDLNYEIQMLNETAIMLSGRPDDGPLKNALLESFAIHARNLVLFFHPEVVPRPHPGDVLARHYVPGWAGVRQELPGALSVVAQRVNKEIVHLSVERLDVGPEAKHWQIARTSATLSTTSSSSLWTRSQRTMFRLRLRPRACPYTAYRTALQATGRLY